MKSNITVIVDGKKLYKAIEKHCSSMRDFSKRSKVSVETIRKYRNGDYSMWMSKLDKILFMISVYEYMDYIMNKCQSKLPIQVHQFNSKYSREDFVIKAKLERNQ